MNGRFFRNRIAPPSRTRKRAARPGHQQSSRARPLRVEQLEDRITPSVTSVFELDANVTTTTTHDWDQVFADNNATPPPVSGAVASAFVTDPSNSRADDIFQAGGSKDTLGIQQGQWLFTDSKPQGKDDITHAYAALYTDPSNGHSILYAGLDRYDNSGDATAGFWFFRNNIAESPNVSGNGTGPFLGTHADGDILLVSDFTQGGSTSTIKVFKWVGDDSTGSLVFVGGNASNTFAIVNSDPISVPWSYTNKSGESQPAHGEFLEEGVDLTALGLSGCFASFLAETRSSQSPTATLSDFVVGSFPVCSLAAPQFSGLSKVGDSVTYPLTVQNTGAMPLYLQNVTDTLLGNIVVNGHLQQPGDPGVNPFVTSITTAFDLTQPLAPGQSTTFSVTRTVQKTDPDPTFNTVMFSANDEPDFSDTPITASVTDSVNLFQPSATMTVVASPTTATSLGQVITYTYMVNNTSSPDSPNLVLSTSDPNNSFTDTLLTTAAGYNLEADAIAHGGGSVAPGGSFTFTETRAIMAGDPTPLTNTSTVVFTLAQNLGNFSNQITAQASASVTLLPHLTIAKAVTGDGTSAVIHPGDTASFTITVTNDGAGPATNVVVTDQLPEPDLLNWSVFSSTFDTASISTGDLLTASKSSLAAGASISVTVNAPIPLDIFGTSGPPGNGDPLPSGLFELDGNAFDDPSVAGDDWSNVLFGDGGSAVAHSFVTDAVNSRTDDIFTGGGSKDILGVQQGAWLFTASKPQAKDDITHAFAATYTDPVTKDVILYAGLDRYDNSGDATAGFWFFQNPIGENPNVTTNGGHPFTGTHADGDILLVSDFTQGGSTSTIKVFRWTGDDATGSLVPVATPPNSTFAIVNGVPITVPWAFMDKSHNPGPAPGEFLEEGVNLSALGLGGCFSNFLAETRSSQSPTATLSDFVIGNFNTCRLDLPNTATVTANGLPTLTSNQALITVLDGSAQLAEAVGSGAVPDSLTAQQLQLVVAQAIDAWRAAGVDPRVLSNLDRVAVHVDNLPGAELGFASLSEIWIDRTAAGWGWSVGSSSAGSVTSGRMDLLTVVTHELGHALGFEHSDTGTMEPTLAPGVRLVPEALGSTSNVVVLAARPGGPGAGTGATTIGAPAIVAGESGAAPNHAPLSSSSRTEAIDAAFATAVRGVALPATTGALQDGAGSQSFLPGALLNLGQPSAPVFPATATIPAVPARPDRDASGIVVPGLLPPVLRLENGGGDAVLPSEEPQDPEQTEWLGPWAAPADTLDAEARVGVPAGRQACDACFADGSWRADRDLSAVDDSGTAPDSATAAAALAVVLGGYWGTHRGENERRVRRRFLI